MTHSMKLNYSQLTQFEPKFHTVEASTFGLAPGQFPSEITVMDDRVSPSEKWQSLWFLRFARINDEVVAAVYLSASAERIDILND